jgi:DNA polymerase-3 subunit beta
MVVARPRRGNDGMRLVIDKGELLRALGHVTSVVERRTTIPILSNVLLIAAEGSLGLKATDLEREVVEQAPARVEQPGATTVSAHVLHDIVRKLPDGAEVALQREPEKERLMITAGQARFSLQTLAADDFPDLTAGECTSTFELTAADLARLLERTRFAISTEETRYYLNGIYLHTAIGDNGPVLRSVATDGHRLALVELPRPEGAEGMPGVIVPRKTVHELNRLLADGGSNVGIALSAAKIRFEIGTVTLTSKLIDGNFPDYGRVIPRGNDRVLEVPNAEFMSAVDRVATISSDRARAIKLSIADAELTLSVTNPEGGSATEKLPVTYNSTPIDIGFNARYLLDISGQLATDKARFLMADPSAPVMIRDGDDASTLYVLMPMRV